MIQNELLYAPYMHASSNNNELERRITEKPILLFREKIKTSLSRAKGRESLKKRLLVCSGGGRGEVLLRFASFPFFIYDNNNNTHTYVV